MHPFRAPTSASEPPYTIVTLGPNWASLLKDGLQAFPAMLDAIASAQTTVCVETYALRDDLNGLRFINALIERAYAGVEVLLMYDYFGSDLQYATVDRLQQAGVKVLAFRPFTFNTPLSRFIRRDHRKSLVVDGCLSFVGGLNLSNDYAALKQGGQGWRDTNLGIAGPTAQDVERLFLRTWRKNKGPSYNTGRFLRPLTAGTSKLHIVSNAFSFERKGVRHTYLQAFYAAKKSILITNAYFLPPTKILMALLKAAKRGVRVAVILGGSTDIKIVLHAARALYPRLLRHGVEIYEWYGPVLHAKTAVVDGIWCTVGSANLDAISSRINLEINAVVSDATLSAAMECLFNEDLANCQRVTQKTVQGYGMAIRFLSWLAFKFRRWL